MEQIESQETEIGREQIQVFGKHHQWKHEIWKRDKGKNNDGEEKKRSERRRIFSTERGKK